MFKQLATLFGIAYYYFFIPKTKNADGLRWVSLVVRAVRWRAFSATAAAAATGSKHLLALPGFWCLLNL